MTTTTDKYRNKNQNKIYQTYILFLLCITLITSVSAMPLTVQNTGWAGKGHQNTSTTFVFYVSSDRGANISADVNWVALSDYRAPAGLNVPITAKITVPDNVPSGLMIGHIRVDETSESQGQVNLINRISIPVKLEVQGMLGPLPLKGNITTPEPTVTPTVIITVTPTSQPIVIINQTATVSTPTPTVQPTLQEDNPSGAIAGWFARGENASMIFVIAFFGCVGLWYIMRMRREND
jgi:hypothetical protein